MAASGVRSSVLATGSFHGHAVHHSPFGDGKTGRLGVACSQYFGLIGNGRLIVADYIPDAGSFQILRQLDTRDVLLDCAWNEANEMLIAGACSDGTIKLWDLGYMEDNRPHASYPRDRLAPRDIYCIDWNIRDVQLFANTIDKRVDIWAVLDNTEPVRQLQEHRDLVFSAAWSPHQPTHLATASADRHLKIWDIYAPRSAMTISAHAHHVLSCDWNKYDEFVLATSSADKTVRLWDTRKHSTPLLTLSGHRLPVKNVRWSPFSASALASVSYDGTLRLWNVEASLPDPLITVTQNHSEFGTGLSFSLSDPHQVATCGWDSRVVVNHLPPF